MRDYLQRSKLLSEKANSVQGQKSNCRLLNKAFEDFHFKMSPGKLELGGINFLKTWNDLIFSFYRPSVTMKPAQIWFSQNCKKLLEEVKKHVVTIIFWVNIQFNINVMQVCRCILEWDEEFLFDQNHQNTLSWKCFFLWMSVNHLFSDLTMMNLMFIPPCVCQRWSGGSEGI